MGTIRTLLALCVAVFHSFTIGGFGFTGGRVSVQCFYIISGFYMALILNEKYTGADYSYKSFVKSRLLRIYPAYFAVLLLSFSISLIGLHCWNSPLYLGLYIPHWDNLGFFARCWFILENLIVIGQENLFFMKVNLNTGALSFTHDAFMEKPQLFLNGFTFVPQAWTLSLELFFYFLAPFLVRRKWYLQLGVVAASLALRIFLIKVMNWKFDPWTYRFFPNELAFFMAGSLMYLICQKVKELRYAKTAGLFALVMVIECILLYDKFDVEDKLKCWVFYAFFALCLPFIFTLTKNSRVDRFIGELSYPIYLIHHLVMILFRKYFWAHPENMQWFGVSTAAVSIPAALLLYLTIIRPIEKFRVKGTHALNTIKVK